MRGDEAFREHQIWRGNRLAKLVERDGLEPSAPPRPHTRRRVPRVARCLEQVIVAACARQLIWAFDRLVAAGRVSRPEPCAAGLLLVQDQEDLARAEYALDRREHLGQRLRQLSTKPGLPEDERDRPRLDA